VINIDPSVCSGFVCQYNWIVVLEDFISQASDFYLEFVMYPQDTFPLFINQTDSYDNSFLQIGNVQPQLGSTTTGAILAIQGLVNVANTALNPVEVAVVNNTATNGFIPYYSTSEPHGPPQQYFYEITSSATADYWSKFKRMLFGGGDYIDGFEKQKEDKFFKS